jgi:hypothetical protein
VSKIKVHSEGPISGGPAGFLCLLRVLSLEA